MMEPTQDDSGQSPEDGWSIHVPSSGFRTTHLESGEEPDPLLVSARQLRVVLHDDEPASSPLFFGLEG